MTLIDSHISRQFERLPPHDVPAEMCLLASLMLDKDIVPQVRGVVDRDAFFQADHQIIFDVIGKLYDERKACDSIILRVELGRRQLLEEIGGSSYLGEILNTVPSAAHAMHYAGIVREKYMWRQVISLSNDMLRDAYAPHSGPFGNPPEEKLMLLSRKAAQIAAGGRANQMHRIGEVATESLSRCAADAGGDTQRIKTGLTELDRYIGGLRRGGKTIVGGKPGMGKSALIKQFLDNIASAGIPVGLITIEEKRHKVAENRIAARSGIPNNRIAFANLSAVEYESAALAVDGMQDTPFWIVDAPRKLSEIVAMAHLLVAQHGCQVIAVDHLHIVDGEADLRDNREREISKISAELKFAWKDLNVAGVEACQLNRKGGRDKPTLENLRDSGSLEQDGDTILLLHREDYYRRTEGGVPDGRLEVLIAKNKDGATADVPVNFDEATQLISDLPDPFASGQPYRPAHGGFDANDL